MAGAGAEAGVRSREGPLRADGAHPPQVPPAKGRGRGPTDGSASPRPVRRGRPGVRRTRRRSRWASRRRRRSRWARWSERRAWSRRTRPPDTRGPSTRRRPGTRGPSTRRRPGTRGTPAWKRPATRGTPAWKRPALVRYASRDSPGVSLPAEDPSAISLRSRTDPPWVRIGGRSVRPYRFSYGRPSRDEGRSGERGARRPRRG
jgi:hypothetical protein